MLMASNVSGASSSKKRHSFLSSILSTKNLPMFRQKNSSTHDEPKPLSKKFQSQLNVNKDSTSVPPCISRGWLKRRPQRPLSFDFDLVQNPNTPDGRSKVRINQLGTRLDFF